MRNQGSAKFFTALAIGSSLLCVAVAAQSIAPEGVSSSPLYFGNVDKNHDGLISQSEVPKEIQELRVHFGEYDANHDHRLSAAEYSIYLKRLASSGSGACSSSQGVLTDPTCDESRRFWDAQHHEVPPPPLPPPSGTGR